MSSQRDIAAGSTTATDSAAAGFVPAITIDSARRMLAVQQAVMSNLWSSGSASLEFALSLTKVKSFDQYVDLATAHARKQLDCLSDQLRKLGEPPQ